MISDARSVSHLVALVMNDGVPGGPDNILPVVYDHNCGMKIRLVRADAVRETLGRIEKPYTNLDELMAEVLEAHRKWGFPTAERIAQAFPRMAT